MREEKNYLGLFRSMHEDWTLSIERVRPTWCEGWCETISQDPEQPLDLEYIREQWGGQRFKLVIRDGGQHYVTSFRVSIDAPPKRGGIIVKHPDEIERERRMEELERERSARAMTPAAAPAPAIDPTLGQMLADSIKSIGESKDAQVNMLWKMVDKKTSEPEGRRDMKELLELAGSMREFADMFGINQGGDSGGDFFSANAGRFLDMLDKKQELDLRKQPGGPGAPRGQRQIRVVKNLGPNGEPAAASQQQQTAVQNPESENMSRNDLAVTLGGMSPMDSCAVLMGALHRMDPDDRSELLEMLMGQELPDDGEVLEQEPEETDEEAAS